MASTITELFEFETHDLKTYKLNKRPGLSQMLSNLDNPELSSSLSMGLRLCLNSTLSAHQRIVQILTLLESGSENWTNLNQKFKNSKDFEKWHAHYLDVTTIIEHTITGAFKTLCCFLTNSTDDLTLTRALGNMKEGKHSIYDGEFVPWGKGSIVHSLIDTCFLYLDDKNIEKNLKKIFVEKVNKNKFTSNLNEEKFDIMTKELEAKFQEDLEYKFDRVLEEMEKEWRAQDFQIKRLKDGSLFEGNLIDNEACGYGWQYSKNGEVLLYRGEFKNSYYHGYGELIKDDLQKSFEISNTESEEEELRRYYLGGFYKGKPSGMGIWYREDGKIAYVGESVDGLKQGMGELRDERGNIVFRGNFFRGMKRGFGIEYGGDGIPGFIGEYLDGERQGYGIEVDWRGKKIGEGFWANGKKVD